MKRGKPYPRHGVVKVLILRLKRWSGRIFFRPVGIYAPLVQPSTHLGISLVKYQGSSLRDCAEEARLSLTSSVRWP